jgi:hypothetical protein
MLKKMIALSGALAVFATAAYAGPSCCAAKTATAKTTSAETKSCCAAKSKQAGAAKTAAACCAKGAKTTTAKTVAAKNTKTAKKLTNVRVCPMMGAPVHGKGGGSQIVGSYHVHFCCAGCKPAFNKLSTAEKNKKIQEALKKQNAAAKAA